VLEREARQHFSLSLSFFLSLSFYTHTHTYIQTHWTHSTHTHTHTEVLGDVMERGYNGFRADVWSLGVILFILLVGKFPFDTSVINRYRQVLRKFDETKDDEKMIAPKPFYVLPKSMLQSKGLSKEAYDLISKLLEVDHHKRISIKQILSHPWIRSHGKIRIAGKLKTKGTFYNKSCWCVLGRGCFKVYETSQMQKLIHNFQIGQCGVREPPEKSNWLTVFDSNLTPVKKFTFVASNAEEREKWSSAISMEVLGDGERGESAWFRKHRGTDSTASNVIDQSMEAIIDTANKLYSMGEISRDEHENMVENALCSAGTDPLLPPKAETLLRGPLSTNYHDKPAPVPKFFSLDIS